MKDETLLDIAAYNYRSALKNYRIVTGDERELNTVGYLLQQSVELCIKHNLEVNGIRYAHSHIIEDLLDEAEGCVVFTEEFYNFAPALTRWEAKSRYIKNYKLHQKQIERAFPLVKQFLVSNGVVSQDLVYSPVSVRDISAF